MTTQTYAAFPASDVLQDFNTRFISNINAGVGSPQATLLIQGLNQFVDECLDYYFLRPVEMVKLGGVGKKIVNGGVSGIKKTAKLAISKIVCKLSNEELKPIAAYIDSMMKDVQKGDKTITYIAVPVSEQLSGGLRSATHVGRNGDPHRVAEDFSLALCGLIDESLAQYFEEPLNLLHMGFLMEKIAKVATESTRSAAHTVVKKVPKTMSEKELLMFFEFADSLLLDAQALAA